MDIYPVYQMWCSLNGPFPTGKLSFYNELRERGLMRDIGTVKGHTMHNVIVGYRLTDTPIS